MLGTINQEIVAIAQRVRLLVLDFDGVLTDNHVYCDQNGTEQVRCWRGDGIGLNRLQSQGISVYILSTETNPVVATRARKLGVPVQQGVVDKAAGIKDLAKNSYIDLHHVAFVGNDVNDLPALKIVGLPIAVADAHRDIQSSVKMVTTAMGGKGAVREVCDFLCSLTLVQLENE